MSTSFQVYATSRDIPSFGQLLELANIRIDETLRQLGIDTRIELAARILTVETNQGTTTEFDRPVTWSSDEYAWFQVPSVGASGIDAYFLDIDDDDREMWHDLVVSNPRARTLKPLIERGLEVGHYWSFRRSTGQPAACHFIHGLVATSLAELTNGFIHSIDSACDYDRVPASPQEFHGWYFDPAQTADPVEAGWYRKCLVDIAAGRQRR